MFIFLGMHIMMVWWPVWWPPKPSFDHGTYYDHLWSFMINSSQCQYFAWSSTIQRVFQGFSRCFFWAPRKICQAKIVGATHIGLLVVCREKWGLLFQPVVSRTANTCWFFLFIRAVQSLNIATCRCIMASGVGKNLTIWMTLIMLTYVNIYHDPKKIGKYQVTSTTCPFLRKPTLGQCALAFQVCEELIDPGVNSLSETIESNQCHRAEHPKVRISVAESGSINGFVWK